MSSDQTPQPSPYAEGIERLYVGCPHQSRREAMPVPTALEPSNLVFENNIAHRQVLNIEHAYNEDHSNFNVNAEE